MKTPDELMREMDDAISNEEQQESDELPPITKISIDVLDGRGKRYAGEFTVKVPNLGDQIRVGQLKAHYLPQGGMADPNALLLVEQICYLEVAVMKKPDWWQPFQFYDATPVSALYTKVASYEARFHGEDAHSGELQEGAGGGDEDAGGSSTEGDAHVGRKVQPPTKRRETLLAHSQGSS